MIISIMTNIGSSTQLRKAVNSFDVITTKHDKIILLTFYYSLLCILISHPIAYPA